MNCSYNVLALSSGSALGATFDGMSFIPSRFWDAEDRIILGYISKPFGLSLHVLGNTSSRHGPWALMESGPGSQILWPHNSPLKSCCPAPRTERRVWAYVMACQVLSFINAGASSFAWDKLLVVRHSFNLPTPRSCRFGTRGAPLIRSLYGATQIQQLKTALGI